MKHLPLFLILLLMASCNDHDKMKESKTQNNKNHSTKVISRLLSEKQKQDSTNILGDKILLSDQKDINGLSSPATILILGEFADSLKAIKARETFAGKVELLNTEKYYYLNKSFHFILICKNLADSNHYTQFKKTIIYQLRPNNFADDILLRPDDLKNAYRKYEISLLDTSGNVYLIKPKKEYDYARMFIRLIKYNEQGVQQKSLTINDFVFKDGKQTEKGYMLALNDFGHGATRYFVDEPYSYKLVWLDKDLHIVGNFHVTKPGTEITAVSYKGNKYSASFEMHLGCDMCDWDFCKYDIFFNKKFEATDIDIWQQPRGTKVIADTLLLNLKKQIYMQKKKKYE